MNLKDRLQSLKNRVEQSKSAKEKIKANYSGTLSTAKRLDRIEELLKLK